MSRAPKIFPKREMQEMIIIIICYQLPVLHSREFRNIEEKITNWVCFDNYHYQYNWTSNWLIKVTKPAHHCYITKTVCVNHHVLYVVFDWTKTCLFQRSSAITLYSRVSLLLYWWYQKCNIVSVRKPMNKKIINTDVCFLMRLYCSKKSFCTWHR